MSFARSRTARDLLSSLRTLVSPPFIYPICGKTIDLSVIHTHFLSGTSYMYHIAYVCTRKKRKKKEIEKTKPRVYQGDTYSAT